MYPNKQTNKQTNKEKHIKELYVLFTVKKHTCSLKGGKRDIDENIGCLCKQAKLGVRRAWD